MSQQDMEIVRRWLEAFGEDEEACHQIEAATSTDDPLTLSLKSKGGAAIEIAPLENGGRGKPRAYTADGNGKVTIALDRRATVKQGGRGVKGQARLRLRAAKLRRGVFVRSIDSYGNTEKAKRIRRR
jgi:hypothetical protein